MSHSETDLNEPDSTMSVRNQRSVSQGLVIGYGLIGLIVLPFLLQKMAIADFGIRLAFVMACGLIVAGLWGVGALLFTRDALTDRQADDRQTLAIISLVVSLILALLMFLAVWLVTSIGSHSWAGYSALKSGGWLTYVILGLLPVVAYILALHAVVTRQIITSLSWRIVGIICLVVSLLAPWFWIGYKVYTDYHVL